MALTETEELELLELEEQEATASQQPSSGGSSQWDVAKGMWRAFDEEIKTPSEVINQAYKSGIGRVAEFAGGMGANPYATAAVLTPIAMAPEILGAVTGFRGARKTGITGNKKLLSPQYEAQNEAIGVTRRIPQEGGRLPTFAKPELQGLASKQPRPMTPAEPLPGVVPERYPGKPGDFMAYANQKLGQFGDRISPQELMDWEVKLGTDMSNPNVIPRFNPQGGTTTIYQQASDLASRTKSTFNKVAEARLKAAQLPEGVMRTRAALDQAYGLASRVQEYTRRGLGLAWKVGKAGAVAAIAGAGIGAGYRAFK